MSVVNVNVYGGPGLTGPTQRPVNGRLAIRGEAVEARLAQQQQNAQELAQTAQQARAQLSRPSLPTDGPVTGGALRVGVNAANALPALNRNFENFPLVGRDCFDSGCYEADLRCSNRVLPGTARFDPCTGQCVNKYNYFPYKYVVDSPGGYGRRRWH